MFFPASICLNVSNLSAKDAIRLVSIHSRWKLVSTVHSTYTCIISYKVMINHQKINVLPTVVRKWIIYIRFLFTDGKDGPSSSCREKLGRMCSIFAVEPRMSGCQRQGTVQHTFY